MGLKMARWMGLIVLVVGLILGNGLGRFPESATAQYTPRITKIAWSPDGASVAVGYENGGLEIRNVLGNQPPLILTGHNNRLLAIAWNSTGTQLASGGEQELFIWNASNGQMVRDLNAIYGYPSDVLSIDWNRNDSQIAVFVFSSPTRQTWNAATFQLMSEIDDAQMGEIIWSLSGNNVAAGTTGGLDIRDPMTFNSNAVASEPGISAAAWSPGAQRIVTGNWSGQIRIWDVIPGEPTSPTLPELPLNRTLRASTVEPDFVTYSTFTLAVAFNLSGNRVYSVSGSGEFAVWDANEGGLISTTQLPDAPITAAAFNQLGTQLAVGDANGILHILDVESWEAK